MEHQVNPFNSALETGVRTLAVLTECYPKAHDLSRLVKYDYLTVHSADAGGPPSLHPPLPFRTGELLVRRGLIESGLRLMISRNLVRQLPDPAGFLYQASEAAGAFLDNIQSPYTKSLCQRASWIAGRFDDLSESQLEAVITQVFRAWTAEFQPFEIGHQSDLSL